MARIKAAKVSVDLEARSAKFSEALDRAQRQAATSSSKIVRSLGKLEKASQQFEKKVSNALWAPFKKFKKATAPFSIAIKQITNSMKNAVKPFKDFAKYVSGPFVKATKKAKSALSMMNNSLTTIAGVSITGAIAAFTALTVSFSKNSLEMRRWANIVGISYQELNELTFASMQFGISNEQLADGMKDLTSKIEDAAYAGSGALLPFFTLVNEKAEDWQKLSPTEQLIRFSDHLSKMDYKSALYWADEVNGAMAEMTPLLYKGGEYFKEMREEAQMFGASIGGVDQIKKIQSVFARIKYGMRNFFTGVGAAMAPGILNAFDLAMTKFKAHLITLSGLTQEQLAKVTDTEAAGQGFQKFVQEFSAKLLRAVASMLRGVDSLVDSIKGAFDTIVSLANSMTAVLGGNKTLRQGAYDSASTEQQASYDSAKSKVQESASAKLNFSKADQAYIQQRNAAEKFKEQNSSSKTVAASAYGGVRKQTVWADKAAQAQYQEMIKEQNTRVRYRNSLIKQMSAHEKNVEALNDQTVILNANKKLVDTSATKPKSTLVTAADALDQQAVDVESGEAFKATDEEQKRLDAATAERARKAELVKTANQKFMDSAGSKYKGKEIALDAYKATSLQAIEVAKSNGSKKLSIEEKFAKQRVLVEAGAAHEIAMAESELSEDMNQATKDAINAKTNAIKANRDTALDGIEITKKKELEALAKASKEKLDKELLLERSFRDKLYEFKKQYQDKETNELVERLLHEQKQLSDVYDTRLSELDDQLQSMTNKESAAYAEMANNYQELQDEKKRALDDFRMYQQQKALEDAEQDRANKDDLLNNLYDSFSGIDGATEEHDSGVADYKVGQIEQMRMHEDERQRLAAQGKDQLAMGEQRYQKAQLGAVMAGSSQLLAEGAKSNKKMFNMQKAMKISMAMMNMYEGMTAALSWGYPMGPIFAALVGVQGMLSINNIRSQQWSGQAHDGIDSVPNTGTWNLEKGERVTDKRTNADLKQYLYDANSRKQQSTAMQVDAGIVVNGNVTDEAWFGDLLANHREELAYNMREANATGFF
ncbi:hypothetical protein [Vibrio fortis]|uniref:hypothetical protein n=1 Tax=Vibrio fortis TaxID=212667 RepID=UPI0038CD2530